MTEERICEIAEKLFKRCCPISEYNEFNRCGWEAETRCIIEALDTVPLEDVPRVAWEAASSKYNDPVAYSPNNSAWQTELDFVISEYLLTPKDAG